MIITYILYYYLLIKNTQFHDYINIFIFDDYIKKKIYYMSEVFEEIAEITKNIEFLKAILKRMKTITNPEYIRSINIAKSIIEDN